MKRKLLLIALALGTVAGYSSALYHHSHQRRARHAKWQQHVADLCVQAAQRRADELAPASEAAGR